MEPIIKLKGVKKQFGKKVILNSVDLDIYKGEIFGIIGMSGSGKSTLLNTLIGFYEPEEGDILYYSKKQNKFTSVFTNTDEARRNFGFATQSASFYPKLTVAENIYHFGSLYNLTRKSIKKSADYLFNMTGLENAKDVLAQNLSGGMEKKLLISCSIIHNPEILVLDEPTSDLDPISRKSTWELIKKINSNGTTIIISSHFLLELEGVCDRLGILHNGKIIAIGKPQELKSTYFKNDEIIIETSKQRYVQIGNMLKKYSRLKIDTIAVKDSKLLIRTNDSEKVLHQLIHILESLDENIISADIRKPSLEEVFESLESKN